MQIIIDRFEGDYALCEKPDRTMLKVSRHQLPSGVKDGDVLVIEGNKIRLDKPETARRKKAAKDALKDLWK